MAIAFSPALLVVLHTEHIHPARVETLGCPGTKQTSAIAACVIAPAAGTIDCEVSVLNTGTVGLSSVAVASASNTITGCTQSTAVEPGHNATMSCVVHKAVQQTDFDDREATSSTSLSVTASTSSAVARTGQTVTSTPATLSGLQLPVNRGMTVSTSLEPAEVDGTGVQALPVSCNRCAACMSRCCSFLGAIGRGLYSLLVSVCRCSVLTHMPCQHGVGAWLQMIA